MKRSSVVILLSILLAATAAPAHANDARIRFVIGLTFAKANYIAHRVSDTHPASFAKFGARLARLSRREARVLVHVKPSTKDGGVARHQAIQGLKELRVAGRYYVLTVNAKTVRTAARLAFRGTVHLNRGLFRLGVAIDRVF